MNEQGPTILVAEDDPAMLELIRTILEEDGYNVVAARNGLEAVELATAAYPDAAVLDVMMPHVDGYEIARRIREHRALAGIPVIFATARTRAEDIDQAFASGGDDFLKKPFSATELLSRLRALLDRSAGYRPGFSTGSSPA